MSDKSKIEWTDATWNPIRGCSRVSEGCRNCYAERVAARFSGSGQPYQGLAMMKREPGEESKGDPRWTGEIRFIPELLNQPVHWKRPRKIFVNSMSDLFHEKVTDEMLDRIFGVMDLCEHHTFQVLTKRPQRMHDYIKNKPRIYRWPPRNVWMGVSVEDQKTADERIPLLLQTMAAVRWVSYEPALGPVDLEDWMGYAADQFDTAHLDWIVAGGESGPGARPAHPDWFRAVRTQCLDAAVPFFFKQWGEYLPVDQWPYDGTGKPYEAEANPGKLYRGTDENGMRFLRVSKKRAGHLLDGQAWQEFPKGNL
jgi:protein gp37